MLYAPGICDDCDSVFASDLIIAEHPGEPTSYRRSAGPCPHCGGRGHIPEWVYRFHATAAHARDHATPEQISWLTAALRHHLNPPPPAERPAPGTDLTADLVGPWQTVAFELRHTPAERRRAQLTLLLWMLDKPTPPRSGPPRSERAGNGWASRTPDGAQQGTTIASTSDRDGTSQPRGSGTVTPPGGVDDGDIHENIPPLRDAVARTDGYRRTSDGFSSPLDLIETGRTAQKKPQN